MANQTDMRSLINKLVEAASSNKLTTEFVTQHFNSKGFTTFEADGEKWYPKSASSKAGKDGQPILSLSWTTFDGKNFQDAAYKFARVYVNPDTNEVIKAQLAGTKDQVAGEESRDATRKQLESTILDALDKDPELQKMRKDFMATPTKAAAGNSIPRVGSFGKPRLYVISDKETYTSYELDSPAGDMVREKSPNAEKYLNKTAEIVKSIVPNAKVKVEDNWIGKRIRITVPK